MHRKYRSTQQKLIFEVQRRQTMQQKSEKKSYNICGNETFLFSLHIAALMR